MDNLIKMIIALALGSTIMFYLLAYVILPSFADVYEHCGINNPYSAGRGGSDLSNGCCVTGSVTPVACSNCNQSSGYSSFLSNCGSLISTSNNTHCYSCSNFGNKTVNQGFYLILFIVILFGLVFAILKKTGILSRI